MVKLLLQESGSVRAFRLGDGVLQVGSGEKASLRVESPDVADLHFELEVSGQRAFVRAMPGVMQPLVNGLSQAESSIGFREPVQVGGVTLWIDADDSESTVAPSAAIPESPSIAGKKGPSNAKGHFPPREKGPRKNAKANYRGSKRSIDSKRRTVKRGLPNVVLVGGPLLLVLIAFLVIRNRVASTNSQGIYSVSKMLDVVERKLSSVSINETEAELARILPAMDRSSEDETRLLDIRRRIDAMREDELRSQANLAGSKFLEISLKRYEKNVLKGDPDDARIRLFLTRIKEFQRRWPEHQDMAWVDRMETRFQGTVDPTLAPTLEDIIWEIKYLDYGENRDFKRAFELIADVRTRIDAEDLAKLERFKRRIEASRAEHFSERMQKVNFVLKNYDSAAKPVGWLLHLVLFSGDDDMSDSAARKLISIEGADACLRGYEFKYPELYEGILAHPLIEEYARSKKIID